MAIRTHWPLLHTGTNFLSPADMVASWSYPQCHPSEGLLPTLCPSTCFEGSPACPPFPPHLPLSLPPPSTFYFYRLLDEITVLRRQSLRVTFRKKLILYLSFGMQPCPNSAKRKPPEIILQHLASIPLAFYYSKAQNAESLRAGERSQERCQQPIVLK